MLNFNDLVSIDNTANNNNKSNDNNNNNNKADINKLPKLFDINTFQENLKKKSSSKAFDRSIFSNSITAYDLAINCSQQVLFKLNNTPIKDYNTMWLPVLMRAAIGSAVHEFIQDNYDFDETEVVVKIEEFNFSGRVDAINSNNVLIEIKTIPFKDYKQIINTNKPRHKDLLQTIVYKYLLEEYLDKILQTKENSTTQYNSWPKQSHYKFDYIQFIYIAHDLISSDATIEESIQIQKQVKQMLNSKYNKFFFMNVITYDINQYKDIIQKEQEYIKSKLEHILSLYQKGLFTDPSDTFIDKKQCFFCQYKNICPYFNT